MEPLPSAKKATVHRCQSFCIFRKGTESSLPCPVQKAICTSIPTVQGIFMSQTQNNMFQVSIDETYIRHCISMSETNHILIFLLRMVFNFQSVFFSVKLIHRY